jgi:hypothetical protein
MIFSEFTGKLYTLNVRKGDWLPKALQVFLEYRLANFLRQIEFDSRLVVGA